MRTENTILARAAELARQRAPFALATVVWRRAPTSGKPGCKALVTPDGELSGWVGGACSRPAVLRAGLEALRDGQSRLLCLGPENDFGRADERRVVEPISCSSEGAMEVFVEPHLPRTQLLVFGDTPIAQTLGKLASTLGLEVTAVVTSDVDRPDADRVVRGLDLGDVRVDPSTFIVVASLGQYDDDALELALGTDAPYVSLVASRRRATAVLDALRQRGVAEERLARVQAPAGLDLGPVEHDEIAIAVLAEIVKLKAEGVGATDVVEMADGGDAAEPAAHQCCHHEKENAAG